MLGNKASHLSKRKEDNDKDIERWEMDIIPDSINNVAVTRTVIIKIMILMAKHTVYTGHRIMIKKKNRKESYLD